MRRLWTTLMVLGLAIAMAIPAGAVTKGGVPDDGAHPYVGLSAYFATEDLDGPGPIFESELVAQHTCSGTLISPTVYLTAGHCTFGMERAMVWFAEDVESFKGSNGYPIIDAPVKLQYDPWWGAAGHTVEGTPITYTGYTDNSFFLEDLGIVVLDEPVHMATYGALPTSHRQFDGLKKGRNGARFDSVGYGTQFTTGTFTPNGWTPSPDISLKIRLKANPWLVQVNVPGFTGDFSFLLSNNSNSGGTCFGDSGGPNFIAGTNLIAGITSYGLNGSCGGTGGVWRLDDADALSWLANYLP